jgi:acyl-CoA synthetase (AMP-forming)/AMP-acid ligase II
MLQAAPLFDKIVFSKIKERLGGKVRLIVSGGAPLAAHVEEFLKVTMCAPVVQGYGLTETCAASFIGDPDNPVRKFCVLDVMGDDGVLGPHCWSFRVTASQKLAQPPSTETPTTRYGHLFRCFNTIVLS